MDEIRDMERAAELKSRKIEKDVRDADEVLGTAIARRVQAGNAEAVEALDRLVNWVPECGFPKNITPAYYDDRKDDEQMLDEYKREQSLNDTPFCSETYTYEVWGKEDARTFLAYLGQIARALGLEGLRDQRLR